MFCITLNLQYTVYSTRSRQRVVPPASLPTMFLWGSTAFMSASAWPLPPTHSARVTRCCQASLLATVSTTGFMDRQRRTRGGRVCSVALGDAGRPVAVPMPLAVPPLPRQHAARDRDGVPWSSCLRFFLPPSSPCPRETGLLPCVCAPFFHLSISMKRRRGGGREGGRCAAGRKTGDHRCACRLAGKTGKEQRDTRRAARCFYVRVYKRRVRKPRGGSVWRRRP